MATPSTRSAKKALRQLMHSTLTNVPSASLASQSNVAHALLTSLPEYLSATRIGIYLSMATSELRTAATVQHALAAGKTVFVPRLTPTPGHMEMLALHAAEDVGALGTDKWGIPVIAEGDERGREECMAGGRGLDLLVVPGVAFDLGGGRLGHGMGYYDRFFARYWGERVRGREGAQMPFLVGMALAEQVSVAGDLVPSDESDWALDALVVGDGRVIRFRENP
ncbi:MAG: hypothetical protein M1829_000474 [Trizodia sp. TS-e1964]|nr:MAG: hypothetical protein M1829_000474 [Trizodia sp. TS-e1964]